MHLGAVNAADGFAMTMVVILILSLGTVSVLLATILRHRKARDSEVDELLDELSHDEDAAEKPATPDAAVPAEPWEKRADWWKK